MLPDETELDKLLIHTLEAGKDESKKALALFGPVVSVTIPVTVTICRVCKNSGKHTTQAGAAAFFGGGSNLNRFVRVWGNQDNARADLVALLLAVQVAPKTKNLVISTRSEYAIRSIKYYAHKNDACGWTYSNGDILKLIVGWIRCRAAPIHFSHMKKDKLTEFFKATQNRNSRNGIIEIDGSFKYPCSKSGPTASAPCTTSPGGKGYC
jgi:ribonuclease HI